MRAKENEASYTNAKEKKTKSELEKQNQQNKKAMIKKNED